MTATTAPATYNTREEWLVAAVDVLGREVFGPEEITLPAVRVSVGWPGGPGSKNNVIGQCWGSGASEDGLPQIFISPVINDVPEILATLVHELVHAVDDCESGHRGPFAKMAKSVGLEGKMTATHASESLVEHLATIAEGLGTYGHSRLGLVAGSETPKTQGTRMLKVECPADGYVVRTTAKWLALGLPSCPCGEEMVQA